MRFATQSFRAVHLALDRLQMDNSSYGGCPSGYIKPLKGFLYITPLDIPPQLAPPTPSVNSICRGRGVQGRRPHALTRLPDRRTTLRLGRGVWGAPRNTQRILASSGLVYISTRRLVFLSSVLLVFRAAHAAVVPSVPLKTVRRNFKRGCRRFP